MKMAICYTQSMFRRLVLSFAAFLVLQFSWSTVAAYCMHETGAGAQHIGHHAHTEPSDEAGAMLKDKPSQGKKASVHSHCSSCAHGSLMVEAMGDLSQPPNEMLAPSTQEFSLTSIFAQPPERPQWRSAL